MKISLLVVFKDNLRTSNLIWLKKPINLQCTVGAPVHYWVVLTFCSFIASAALVYSGFMVLQWPHPTNSIIKNYFLLIFLSNFKHVINLLHHKIQLYHIHTYIKHGTCLELSKQPLQGVEHHYNSQMKLTGGIKHDKHWWVFCQDRGEIVICQVDYIGRFRRPWLLLLFRLWRLGATENEIHVRYSPSHMHKNTRYFKMLSWRWFAFFNDKDLK